MNTRLLAVGLAAPLALTLTLTACASSQTVNGKGGAGSSSSGSSSPSSTTSSPSSTSSTSSHSTSSTDPRAELAGKLEQGLRHIRTAHLDLHVTSSGRVISGSGDEQLSNGKLAAIDLTESIAQGVRVSVIIVDGKTYVKLPAEGNRSSKPWALVRANSKVAAVRAIAAEQASTRSSASLSTITEFVSAARTVKQTGSRSGTTTYAVDVDTTRLPSSYPGRAALLAAGVTSLPIEMTLDSEGRPVLVTESFTVEGQHVSTRITLSSYNKPVHISAPPAKQVSTS